METAKFLIISTFGIFFSTLPPGLVNMAVGKISLEKDRKNGLNASLGASIMVSIYAFMGILMAKYIMTHTKVYELILKIGVGVFAVLAIYFLFFPKRQKPEKNELTKKDSRMSFVKGFFLSVVNILPLPFFVFLSITFAPHTDKSFTWPQIILFALGGFIGTLAVLYIYTISFVKLKKRLKIFTRNSNTIMGGLMLILLLITLIRMYNV